MNKDEAASEGDNETTNPGQADKDDLFLRLRRWAVNARDHSGEWRKEAEEAYAFRDGDQWSEEDKATLKDQLRPVISFNRVGVVVDSVAGLEVQNRQEVRYLPRQMGKVQVNELLTAAAKWFRDQSFAEDEESDAFLDCVICGMGWVDTRLDYEEDPEGRPVDERVDPIEMYWDPAAKKRNLEDRRFQFRAKKFPLEDAIDMFPDYKETPELLHAAWFDNMPQSAEQPHNALEAKFYKNDQSDRESGNPAKKVMIVQAQWWDREDYYRVADPQSGKVLKFPKATYEKLCAKVEEAGGEMPQAVKSKRRVYKQAFIGAEVLETDDIAKTANGETLDRFTINCITGKRDRNENIHYGIVRAMKDPQRWANKFFSSLIHQFATSGKGVIIETDAVNNIRNFEEEWARADGIKWARPGTLGKKIQELQGAQINQGVSNMMEYAIGSMRDVTGVNIELMGQAEKDQPGILEYQRKQAGLTILAGFFDGLRRFRKTQGHVLLYYIKNFFSDGRLIKIDGEEGQQFVPLVRDPNLVDFDVIVDDAPSSPNQKEHTWLLITQLMPMLQNVADPNVWIEFLKYSPLPSSLTEKLTQMVQQKAQQPPQIDPVKKAELQVKAMQAQSQIERNRAGAIKDLSQAGVQGPGPGEEIMKAAVDSLVSSAQSSQDHGEAMQQQDAAHQQQLVQAQQAHAHSLQQADQQHQQALEQGQQAADLAPPPASGGGS